MKFAKLMILVVSLLSVSLTMSPCSDGGCSCDKERPERPERQEKNNNN